MPRYDNTLRLFDAPPHWSQPQPAAIASAASADRAASPAPPAAPHALQCIHRLAGHKNRHWPIRSSIFVGGEYVRGAAQARLQPCAV